ncbi:paraquat-inducible protein A [Thiocapsa imhoffii]|uniref:Paraquat-inducible protein A n=1 Tax=Thiocapsa imhoffii TaxID=382777 RepID=A0A9X0WL68_9GAMM|nr:paraquat-inducible protein A [Thiocapsa imhoffii]MBK1646739.1 paraquat-inducible protein A [Thiocapsa imhoffii]
MRAERLIRRLLVVAVLIAATWLTSALIADLQRVTVLKTEMAELQHIRYGLLDADLWVVRIGAILERRIDEFDLSAASREGLTKTVTELLDTIILEMERSLRQRSPPTSGNWLDQLQGALQQGLQELVFDVTRLRDQVPAYADALVAQLDLPVVQAQLKTRLKDLLQQALATSGGPDRTALQALLAHHGCVDVPLCVARIETAIAAIEPRIPKQLGATIGLVMLLFLVALTKGGSTQSGEAGDGSAEPGVAARSATLNATPVRFDPLLLAGLMAATLVLLVGGLTTPMITVDARLAEISIQVLGEPIVFRDQVLYFQSKSILDVMRVLIDSGGADMLFVAVLLTLFSLIFPLLKLLATGVYVSGVRGARGSAVVRFFALRSGKWSMADVMVVAIFMAYVGFEAVVANQLSVLRAAGPSVAVLTTNATALEPGFFLFLSFVLGSLVLSSVLDR